MAIYKSNKATKDGRIYFFRIKYKDILGNTKDYTSQKYLKRKDAEAAELQYKLNISMNKLENNSITLKEVYIEYMNTQKGILKRQSFEKKQLYYSKYISFLDNVKINDLTVKHYLLFKNNIESFKMTADYSNKIQNMFSTLIKFSNKYHNTSNNILNYFEQFKDVNVLKKEIDFYTYEEFLKFINYVDDFDYKVFFQILYYLGLRKGECQALTWKDINFEKEELSINKTLTTRLKGECWTISSPKTKSSNRILPIPKNILNGLKTLNNNAKKYIDYNSDWFVFGNSVPFKENTIRMRKIKYCKAANIREIRIHDFRHSCASLLINKGASISLVSKYLGHSDISITLNTYTHMYKNELTEMTKIIDNL